MIEETTCVLHWYHIALLAFALAVFTGIGMLAVARPWLRWGP